MKIRKTLAAAAALAITGGLASVSPAGAVDTPSTITITGGLLSIAVNPAQATPNIVTVAAGQLTGSGSSFGTVTVSDLRGAAVASWTARASSTDFTTPAPEGTAAAALPSFTIPASSITYSSGAGTKAATDIGVFTPGTGLMSKTTVEGVGEVASAVGTWLGTGSNTVSWSPSFAVALLSSQVAGTYTGTITHSVS